MSLLPLDQERLLENTLSNGTKTGKMGKIILSDSTIPTLFAPLPLSKKNKNIETVEETKVIDNTVNIGKKRKVT